MSETTNATINFITTRFKETPEVGIILGTGLGGLVREIDVIEEIPYSEIPDFPVSTVEGIKYLFVSNASGGVNPDFEIGDLMVITDHICIMPNPLIGKHNPEDGDRFPDMSCVYDKSLIASAEKVAAELGYKLQKGVYLATTGPTFETPAEYRYFRVIGADTVGMSTVPEAIVARQMRVPCFAMSIITDLGVPGKIVEVSHEEVQKVAAVAESKMTEIFTKMIERL